jgi:hypothetical protein
MLLLRALARLVTTVLLAALALCGLAVAIFSLGGGDGDLSIPGLARLAQLDDLRGEAGALLAAVEAEGPVALASLLGGLAAAAVGVALLVGALWPRRERLVLLEHDPAGDVSARRRALGGAAVSLAERTRGVSAGKARVRPRRRGRGGRLAVRASMPASADRDEVARRVRADLRPLTEPYALRARVSTRVAGRVQ